MELKKERIEDCLTARTNGPALQALLSKAG
jgi:hypothetical protein